MMVVITISLTGNFFDSSYTPLIEELAPLEVVDSIIGGLPNIHIYRNVNSIPSTHGNISIPWKRLQQQHFPYLHRAIIVPLYCFFF